MCDLSRRRALMNETEGPVLAFPITSWPLWMNESTCFEAGVYISLSLWALCSFIPASVLSSALLFFCVCCSDSLQWLSNRIPRLLHEEATVVFGTPTAWAFSGLCHLGCHVVSNLFSSLSLVQSSCIPASLLWKSKGHYKHPVYWYGATHCNLH